MTWTTRVRLGDRLFLLSPRPARILADLPIRTPRSQRGDAEIAAIKLDIMRRINGDSTERDSLIGSARSAVLRYVIDGVDDEERSIGIAALGLALVTVTATAQDMMRHVDLSSPDMVSAEMTRGRGRGCARRGDRRRARGFHRKEIIRPRPLRAQFVRRDFPRGTSSTRQSSPAPDSTVQSSTRPGCSRRT